MTLTGLLDSFKLFHDQLISTPPYKQWASKNPGDATRWTNYSNAILAGKSPSPPKMSTGFGKALALSGQIILQKVAAGYGISAYGADSYGEQ